MTALNWATRLAIFFLLMVFSLQNTDSVSLQLLPGQIWQVSLIFVLLIFFAIGVLLGAVSMLGVIFRLRREIAALKRLSSHRKTDLIVDRPPAL